MNTTEGRGNIAVAGTWNTEARRVVLLAAELGVPLDMDDLILRDVRELHALRQWLRTRPTASGGRLGVRRLAVRLWRTAHGRPLAS